MSDSPTCADTGPQRSTSSNAMAVDLPDTPPATGRRARGRLELVETQKRAAHSKTCFLVVAFFWIRRLAARMPADRRHRI